MAKKKKKKQASSSNLRIILLIIACIFVLAFFVQNNKATQQTTMTSEQQTSFDFGNSTILLDGQELTFTNGTYVSSDEQHQAEIVSQRTSPSGTRTAAILIDNPGGSGTFYYLLGAMDKKDSMKYAEPVALGDRIKIISLTVDDPQEYDEGIIVVKYDTRPEGAPFAEEPTVEVVKRFAFEENGNLIEIMQ